MMAIGIQDEVVNVDDIVETANHFRCMVGRLRKKIEAVGEQPYIQNVFGLGYRMEEE